MSAKLMAAGTLVASAMVAGAILLDWPKLFEASVAVFCGSFIASVILADR